MNLNDLLVPPPPEKPPSPYQLAIYAAEPPIIVQAVAGSGKTHTLVTDINKRKRMSLCLAFNKPIANELATRVSQATVKTLNALGHQILMRKRPGAKLDAWRISKRLRQILNAEDSKLYSQQLARAISLVKSNADFQPDYESFIDAMNAYELDIPIERQASFAQICNRVFWEMYKNLETFDYDDQLYVPIKEGWTFPKYDMVYVDEAQDLSQIQHFMIQALADRGAMIFAVGDRAQAIYGFRGATSSSMDDMKQQFKMIELPLSITYRCCLAVVREAQRLVPHIEARPNAPEGSVNRLDSYPKNSSYTANDLIVCRNNAPIFTLALRFLLENRQCRVRSNFLETIESFLNQFDANYSKDLRIKLDHWYQKEKKEAIDNNRYGKLAAIEDKYKVVCAFTDKFPTLNEIIAAIRSLATSEFGPRIATVHKAKGLEAPRVYILRPDLLPSPKALTPQAIQAEKNLEYVAITRAKDELNYLPREDGL
jgi:DNA helicase II / ATP-dependent DNA helicase PcrA